MARSRGDDKPIVVFFAVFFTLGVILGAALASIWIQGLPVLQLFPGDTYARSITIVGVDKATGEGRLATLTVEIRAGAGRLAIEVPPYENEDTQQAALDARSAAEYATRRDLSLVDIWISIENLPAETTIAGPSASAAVAVLIVAVVNASENGAQDQVNQGAVISAAIDSTGRLKPVGEIAEKYQTVRAAGTYSLFVIAKSQPGYLPNYSDISVMRASDLTELAGIVLW